MILPVIVILASLVSTSLAADSCDDSFGKYLEALKDQINNNAQSCENEFLNDFDTLVHKCFSPDGSGGKCALSDEDLNTDVYGDSGPNRGCANCQKMCKSLRDKFLHSPDSERKCLRQHFGQAVREEIEPCIQAKIPNGYSFKVPPIPDFDEQTFKYIDVVEKGVDHRIMAYSRLDVCRNANPAKFQVTSPCMANGYSGIYALHCKNSQAAKAKAVSSSCESRFNEVKKASCECLYEKRVAWHAKFAQVYKIVTSTTDGQQCTNDVAKVLGAWLGKIQDALTECLPASEQNKKTSNIRTLIELGCGQVAQNNRDGTKQFKNELTTGFRFVRLFLDALNDRILVYCDKNCSY